jgi:hypothetical protein
MSKFRDLILDVQDEIEMGVLTIPQISVKYGMSYSEVDAIMRSMQEYVNFDDEYTASQEAYSVYDYDVDF